MFEGTVLTVLKSFLSNVLPTPEKVAVVLKTGKSEFSRFQDDGNLFGRERCYLRCFKYAIPVRRRSQLSVVSF